MILTRFRFGLFFLHASVVTLPTLFGLQRAPAVTRLKNTCFVRKAQLTAHTTHHYECDCVFSVPAFSILSSSLPFCPSCTFYSLSSPVSHSSFQRPLAHPGPPVPGSSQKIQCSSTLCARAGTSATTSRYSWLRVVLASTVFKSTRPSPFHL